MKNFFVTLLAVILGFFITFVLVTLLFFAIGIGILASKDVAPKISSESVLQIDLNCTVIERTIDNPFEKFNSPIFEQEKTMGLNTLSAIVKQAKEDDNIKGIYLDISSVSASLATVEEIRNCLLDFKESGKFIYCYSESLSQMSYYLASVSDKIFLHPQGVIDLRGLASQVLFFKKMFEKIELDMQIVRHGTYKSAVEPFMLDKMSEANREQFQTCLNSMWNDMVANMSKNRSIAVKTIQNTCDSLLILTDVKTALDRGFIDQLMYKDEFLAFVSSELGLDSSKKINFVSAKDYKKTLSANDIMKKDKIAVIYAVGNIADEKGNNQIIGSSTAEEIAKARKDKNVKAIVFRINSGGGSALMSETIWREVELARQEKPIVVSMGDLAASGGYYIACASSYIVAQPNTITGSIGVFGVIPNAEKLLANKLGITVDRVKTNQHSDALTISRPMDNYERSVLQKHVENVYSVFVKRVADGRQLNFSFVNSIGEGRIWSGIDALRLNLVDTLGGIDIAIKKAAELADISNYAISERPIMKDFFQEFLESFMDNSISVKMKKTPLCQTYTYFQFVESALELKGIQARIPYIIEVY